MSNDNLPAIAENFPLIESELLLVDCPKCGQRKQAHHINKHICIDCSHAESSRIMHLRMHQEDWVDVAKAAGLELWERQPGETQWEYSVWLAYRDAYPGKKPTYGDVARQLCTTNEAVKKIAARWTFQVRLQAWMNYCDQVTLAQRRQEIVGMNQQHITMAQTLNEKLATAINCIQPEALKPTEIAALAKLATDLERKARLDTVTQEQAMRGMADIDTVDNANPEMKQGQSKKDDLADIVGILLKTGALGDITHIGVRQTTEVMIADKDGNIIGTQGRND